MVSLVADQNAFASNFRETLRNDTTGEPGTDNQIVEHGTPD
jgi:hypothetical protein